MADEHACPECGEPVSADARFCKGCGWSLGSGTARIEDPFLRRTVDGKYAVDKLLGVGGMSRVYLSTQLSLNKTVCLKVLNATLTRDPVQIQRFHREAEAVSRLNHPHIVQVFDFGQDPATRAPYLAMEYVPGTGLDRLIDDEHPLGEERIVHIMTQVLSALADAHTAGIVHRDLKPANIIVTSTPGTRDFVKVLDFGVAKLVGEGDGGTGLTQAGTVFGTPEYMAPEQARGGDVDARCDIYAVGVMLYRMVANRLPFQADGPIEMATKHLTEEPVPPGRLAGVSVTSGMQAIILKAMDKQPDRRHPDALTLQQELRALTPSGPEAVPAFRRRSLAERFGPAWRRLRWRLQALWRRTPRRSRTIALGVVALVLLVLLWPSDPMSRVESLIEAGKYVQAESLLERLPERKTPLGHASLAAILIGRPDRDLARAIPLLQRAIEKDRGLLGRAFVRRALVWTLDQRNAKNAIEYVVKTAGDEVEDELVEAATSRPYWLRWNSIKALQDLDEIDQVDMVLVYIADLKYAGSCTTRKRAARELAKRRDDRALGPLRAAKERGLLDNLCMTGALDEAIRAIQR